MIDKWYKTRRFFSHLFFPRGTRVNESYKLSVHKIYSAAGIESFSRLILYPRYSAYISSPPGMKDLQLRFHRSPTRIKFHLFPFITISLPNPDSNPIPPTAPTKMRINRKTAKHTDNE